MSVTVRIPTQLRPLTKGSSEIALPSGKLSEVLGELGTVYPELKTRIFDDDGKLRRFINIFVSDEDVRFLDGLDTEVTDQSVVSIVPAVAGGV
jgi:molybdopterin converting factor small subunit